jgi:glutamate carboxypeptidase
MRTIPPALFAIAFTLLGCASVQASPHRNDKVYQAVMTNRAGALDLLREIVDIESGTGDVAGGAQVEGVLANRLRALGADVHTEPAEVPGLPDNLVAVFHGSGKGKILIIAHIDTVFGPGTVAADPSAWTRSALMAPVSAMRKPG